MRRLEVSRAKWAVTGVVAALLAGATFARPIESGAAGARTQEPETPAPVDGPAPQKPGASAPAPAPSPEEAAWKAAMDQKQAANVANEPKKGLEAAAGFVAFREAYPQSAHATDALVECGVSWMIAGRAQQHWHRNPPEGADKFKTAIEWFQRVPKEHPADPAVARAEYCTGLAWVQLDKLPEAEKALSKVIEAHTDDRVYLSKALERRAAVRRHRLDIAGARADMAQHVKLFGAAPGDAKQATDEQRSVERYSGYASVFGQTAPALAPEVWANGEPVKLSSMKGEVVALYFFAQWCHNCLNEASFIHEMNERWSPLGVRFVGVTDFSAAPQGNPAGPKPGDATETQKGVDIVKAYLAAHEFPFPVMMDRGATARIYSARKYPELVLIDREGRIAWHDHPAMLLDSTLERLLYGPPETPSNTAK